MRYDARERKLVKRFRRRRRTSARPIARSSRRSARRSCARCRAPRSPPTSTTARADLAIDFCEDVPPLPRADVDRIVALMEAEGMTAKVSSIHVNGWFGSYDKLGDDAHVARRKRSRSISTPTRERFVFVGDSPNDAPMFAYFPNAVGVANVRAVPRPHRDAAGVRHRGGSGGGICRAGGLPTFGAVTLPRPQSARPCRARPRCAAPRSTSPSARCARTSRP